jgi:hypothetical protein
MGIKFYVFWHSVDVCGRFVTHKTNSGKMARSKGEAVFRYSFSVDSER